MKKALITGITGFAGSFLAEHLLTKGYQVSGTYLTDDSLRFLSNKDSYTLYKLNLLDDSSTLNLIKQDKPDYIFHLAALTSPKNSFENPKETFTNNVAAQINLLEAIKKTEISARTLIVSSAEVYGLVKSEDLPIDEDTPYNPTNPYAVSKLSQDYLGLQYSLSEKLDIVRVRPFNHVGPKQAPHFVVASFAKRIVEVEKGISQKMKVGNLKSKRDFSDVRDMVKAYELALDKGEKSEVYNLGSGKSYEIAQILDLLLGMAKVKVEIEEDQSLMMPSDNPELVCDHTKFTNLTGWETQIPIEKTLEDTLEYWRANI